MAAGEEDGPERIRRPSGKKTAKTTAKKTARKTAETSSSARAGSRPSERNTERTAHRVSAPRAMRKAAEQLQELLGRAPESVSAVKPTENGWRADVEVLELERVPGTTSVMASYRVTLDEEGELLAYERTRRYTRGQIDPRG